MPDSNKTAERKLIYMDNAATTRMLPEVLEAMLPYMTEQFYNPSAIYAPTFPIREAIAHAKEQIARAVNCDPDGVYFTSGGTEGDNWVLQSTVNYMYCRGVITTPIEHKAVLNTCRYLHDDMRVPVTYVPVDHDGLVDLDELDNAARRFPNALISVMTANNEVGTVEPISVIGKIAKKYGNLFHTDAVQAAGSLPIDMPFMGLNFLTMSAHKFHGPKGIGAVCVRNAKLKPLMYGGLQQGGLRPGTENVAAIVGMGKAIEIADNSKTKRAVTMAIYRERLKDKITSAVSGVVFNGHPKIRLPNNLSVSFEGVDAQQLLMMLDNASICVSAGSACNTVDINPSHVLVALEVPKKAIKGTIRFSLGDDTTEEDVDYVAQKVAEFVNVLRGMNT